MGIAEIFSLILAVMKAIPILKSAFDKLALMYIENAQKNHDKAFQEAMLFLIKNNDASELEKAADLPNAGSPTPDRRDVRRRVDP